MKEQVYSPQIRLHYDKPEDKFLIDKLMNRNRILHRNVSDYIKHAVYVFEEAEDRSTAYSIEVLGTTEKETEKDDMEVFDKAF